MRLLVLVFLMLLPLPVHAAAPIPPLPPPVPASVQVRPPVVTPAMRHYSRTRYTLYFVATAYGLLALWGVLASGLSARLRDIAQRLASLHWLTLAWFWLLLSVVLYALYPRWIIVLVSSGLVLALALWPPLNRVAEWLYRLSVWQMLWYYLMLSLVMVVVQAPLTFYSGFRLEHTYGLSHQPFGSWLGDVGKSLAVNYVINGLLLTLLFWLIKRSPRRWSLWLWGAFIPIIAFGIFLAPLVVDPLFNKFTPMPPSHLRTRIQALAAKAGIPDAPIYVVDKSKQTETTNAYVTGFGPSTRIVIWDTTLRRMPPDQVVAVVGHEMGHYVLGHLYLGFAEAVLGLLVALPLAQWLVEQLVARFGPRWRLRGLTDPASVPAFLLVLGVITFLADPLSNYCSRQIEHAADAYGIAITQDRVSAARTFVSLSEQNLSDPDPPAFIKFWLFSHPPLRERLEFALGRKTAPER